MGKKQQGILLIELIVFIIVIGIVAVGLMSSFSSMLSLLNNPYTLNKAYFLANARTQAILVQRHASGFSGLIDPCVSSPPAFCTPMATYATANNFTVASLLTTAGITTTITVSVTGNGGTATLVTRVSNY